ncbi:MAG: hypothetical protein KGL35_16005 [Bradyrhizobium sp.]|nr:hypothetical protein [Betaproteobacteria bacterium]MDE2470203.1 hypothetical protein [Bradyrhizobium sp.]
MNERPLLTVEWNTCEDAAELPVQSSEFRLLGSLLAEIMREVQRLSAMDQED